MICNHSAIFHAMTFGWYRTTTLAEVITESLMVLYTTVSISVNPLHVRHVSMVDRTTNSPWGMPVVFSHSPFNTQQDCHSSCRECFAGTAGKCTSCSSDASEFWVPQNGLTMARLAMAAIMASGVWGLVIHSALKSQENQGNPRKALHGGT